MIQQQEPERRNITWQRKSADMHGEIVREESATWEEIEAAIKGGHVQNCPEGTRPILIRHPQDGTRILATIRRYSVMFGSIEDEGFVLGSEVKK
jgi:hypothetical protein